jgi:glycosyltransferase involved in cell wall biosynthesis
MTSLPDSSLHIEPVDSRARRIKVFVHLVHGFGARQWREAWAKGEMPGILDKLPYGYYHAADDQYDIQYSEDVNESRATRFLRLALRHALGLDLLHAWRNRRGLHEADIVWTHTELEHLGVLLLWCLTKPVSRPRLIAQSVWLYDRWNEFSAPKKWLYKTLLAKADILTVLSPDNLVRARELFPNMPVEFVHFGIDSSAITPAVRRSRHKPLRVLSLGRDMHRDWETLVQAIKPCGDWHLRIAATQNTPRRAVQSGKIELIKATTAREVFDLYAWADIVVLPLRANMHASGITVLAEAALSGVPVIASDTGGLRSYFSGREVKYVPVGDSLALRHAIRALGDDDNLRFRLACAAQERILSDDLSSKAYAMRHREISDRLLFHSERASTPANGVRVDRAASGEFASRRQLPLDNVGPSIADLSKGDSPLKRK